jgi:glycosyltransferase involved in cell wall biosynthesis
VNVLEQLAGRQILFLNWRDLSNPAAGGAEAYAEQIARRFAAAGCRLTLFTSAYPDAPPYDWENGYLVVRRGSRFGVYLAAARHIKRYGRQYDAIVDFQNGIPFFAPLWAPADTAVTCVVHHVHQDQFGMYFPWPASAVGRLLEGRVSRRVYRDHPFVAVSPSTRAEMRRQLRFRGPISIVPNGTDPFPPGRDHRSATPLIAVVTRLVPHKQLHLLVAAVPELLRRWPALQVEIAGAGPAREALLSQARELGVEGSVRLPGRVSDQYKCDLLGRAWLTVAPSLAEGWGLTVLEANAMGTPALAYDVPGLRDSVRDNVTGWLVPPGQELSAPLISALEQLADPIQRDLMTEQCRRWARGFSWDVTAQRLARVVLSEIIRIEQGKPPQRRTADLMTVASWPPGQIDEDLERRLEKALRVTDVITRGEHGVRILMAGCDEVEAATALARVGVPPARLRLASTADVLSGAGLEGPP